MIDIGFFGNGNTHVQFATAMEEKSYDMPFEYGRDIPHLRGTGRSFDFVSLLGLLGWCCCAGSVRGFI